MYQRTHAREADQYTTIWGILNRIALKDARHKHTSFIEDKFLHMLLTPGDHNSSMLSRSLVAAIDRNYDKMDEHVDDIKTLIHTVSMIAGSTSKTNDDTILQQEPLALYTFSKEDIEPEHI